MAAVADRRPQQTRSRPRPAEPVRHAPARQRNRLPVNTVPNLVLAAIGIGGLAVLLLWWHDTVGVDGAAEWITGAGRITGLLAGYIAPLLLLLMARVPFLERGIGADRLARWHAVGGRYLVCLLCAHIITIIWGYSLTGGKGFISEGVDIVWDYPEMLKGTTAALLMIGVGIVSARAARRRLSYETWYYLHLTTYLAIALGFSHQIVNGADLVEEPARALWSLYYVGTFAILIWFRLVVPYLKDRKHQLRVDSVRREGPGVVSVVLTGKHLEDMQAEAGQFFRLQFQTRKLCWAANPYSLSAAPHPKYLRFTVKEFGEHSAAVASLRRGTKVRAEGPYGSFTADRVRSRKVLLLAGGVGITPIRALFETLPVDRGDLTLLYRASRPEDVIFQPRTRADRGVPRRAAAVPGRPARAGPRPDQPADPGQAGPAPEGPRRLPVQFRGDGRSRRRRPAQGRGTASSDPS